MDIPKHNSIDCDKGIFNDEIEMFESIDIINGD